MRDFWEEVLFPLTVIGGFLALGLLVIFGVALGATTLNSYWECSSWHKSTGDQTQVIAGDCFVKNGSKWEVFSTYIKNHHVEVTEK